CRALYHKTRRLEFAFPYKAHMPFLRAGDKMRGKTPRPIFGFETDGVCKAQSLFAPVNLQSFLKGAHIEKAPEAQHDARRAAIRFFHKGLKEIGYPFSACFRRRLPAGTESAHGIFNIIIGCGAALIGVPSGKNISETVKVFGHFPFSNSSSVSPTQNLLRCATVKNLPSLSCTTPMTSQMRR